MLYLGADAGFQQFQLAQQLADQDILREGSELAALHGNLLTDFLRLVAVQRMPILGDVSLVHLQLQSWAAELSPSSFSS